MGRPRNDRQDGRLLRTQAKPGPQTVIRLSGKHTPADAECGCDHPGSRGRSDLTGEQRSRSRARCIPQRNPAKAGSTQRGPTSRSGGARSQPARCGARQGAQPRRADTSRHPSPRTPRSSQTGAGAIAKGCGPGPGVAGRAVARNRTAVLLMAQMLGHLLVQRRLQHCLGQLLEQPVGPVRDRPCSRARRTISSAATASAVGSGFLFVTPSSVASITAPLRRATRLSDQGRKHRC